MYIHTPAHTPVITATTTHVTDPAPEGPFSMAEIVVLSHAREITTVPLMVGAAPAPVTYTGIVAAQWEQARMVKQIRQGSGHNTVAAHLATIPEVLEAYTITGAGDMWARVVARSKHALCTSVHGASPTRRRTTMTHTAAALPVRTEQEEVARTRNALTSIRGTLQRVKRVNHVLARHHIDRGDLDMLERETLRIIVNFDECPLGVFIRALDRIVEDNA